jgi:hypothetical protein
MQLWELKSDQKHLRKLIQQTRMILDKKLKSGLFWRNVFYLELFHGNLKTIQAVKEAAVDVAALVNPNMIHYAMVNFTKAADLCV